MYRRQWGCRLAPITNPKASSSYRAVHAHCEVPHIDALAARLTCQLGICGALKYMRILTKHRVLIMSGILLALGLAGCASMSEEECQATDWRTVGYEDGVAGYSGNRIGNYRKSCGEYGVAPDLAQYQSGREMGLREFCVPANGFRVGANGHGYNGVCPAELDRDFTQAYQSGRQLYTLRSRVIDASNELESSRREMNQIDSSIISIGAEMLAPATTQERRAQLLLDTKQMAERKGELKSRIPQLESDLRDYERELEDYRASLSYIE